jgi:hypothetical protein
MNTDLSFLLRSSESSTLPHDEVMNVVDKPPVIPTIRSVFEIMK